LERGKLELYRLQALFISESREFSMPAAFSRTKDGVTGSMGAMGASLNDNVWSVSGVDPNPEARDVFVLCHDRLADKYTLLGSGRIVGSGDSFVPPGIKKGQFRVLFVLREEYSIEDIHVADDRSGTEFLSDITITPASTSVSGFQVRRAGQ
jgi:hypothetical protein